MMYEHIVNRLREVYEDKDASAIKDHVAIQFNIWGEGHGALYMEINNGKIHIEPYEYYDRDTIISTDAETLFGIADGRIDPCSYGDLCVEGDSSRVAILRDLSLKKDDREAGGQASQDQEAPYTEKIIPDSDNKKGYPRRKAVKETARKAAGTVKEKAEELAGAAKGKAEEVADAAKGKAEEVAVAAREKAEEVAGAAKGKAEEVAVAAREKAEEAAGAARGKAEELAGAAKGKAEEFVGAAKTKAGKVAGTVKKRTGRRKG